VRHAAAAAADADSAAAAAADVVDSTVIEADAVIVTE
jgi:hypothetical protein